MELNFDHRYNRGTHRNEGFPNKAWQERLSWITYQSLSIGENPMRILQLAFTRYIQNEPLESNTLGIEIIYIEHDSVEPKSIFILKRSYTEPQPQPAAQTRIIKRDTDTHLNLHDIQTSAHFPNSQLTELVQQLRNKTILQITLCEIYNDSPKATSRRGKVVNHFYVRESREERQEREALRLPPQHIQTTNQYPVFTIPIKLLYRNIPPQIQNIILQERLEYDQERRRLREEQQRIENEEYERVRALSEARENELAIQTQQSRRDQTPEQQAALLEDPFFNNYDDLGEGENIVNPNPLQVVDNSELLNRPITSYHWPGICQICQMDNLDDPICRVDCKQRNRDGSLVPIGHIFHCECINAYHNTRTGYGWNNKCPLCNQRDYPNISSMVQLTPDKLALLPTSFGKKRNKKVTLSIDSDIKYLLKK